MATTKRKRATELTPFTVSPRAMHEMILMPMFGDVIEEESGDIVVPSDEDGDWQIMDDVVVSRPILDMWGGQNILKRREATCKLIYGAAARLTNREIRTTKLYAAIEDCQDEFYQGAFEDYSNENWNVFGQHIMPIIEKGVATDIYTNKYFGDITRASDSNGIWSWNKFDGIVTQYRKYITAGTIPSAQTFSIPSGALSGTQAKAALDAAYVKQDGIMELFDDSLKAYYVDKKFAKAYHQFLIDSGNTSLIERMGNKVRLFHNDIEVKIKKWDSVLKALNSGTESHICILTMQGNFLYAADAKYGGGPYRDEAIRIWYSDDDNVWKRQVHLKAGTEIVAPQHTVFGISF